MQNKDEEKLIALAQKGNSEAYETLISQYEKKIYALCLHLLKDPEEAYDAAQEVCIKVWKQLGLFEGQAKLGTWIYRIATNQCLDLLRKNKNRRQDISLFQETQDGENEWVVESTQTDIGVPEQIEKKELQEIVHLGIQELQEDYQVILVLRDIEGYSYEEIAQILYVSLGTVKSRLSRAREALKKVFFQKKEPFWSFFRHIK